MARPDLGCCQVRGIGPHLWALVAEAMGFRVESMSWAEPAFGRLMTAYGVGGTVLGGLRPRAPSCRGVACVFSDCESLPGLNSRYWRRWSCPHVFHCRDGELGSPPVGWRSCSLRVPHAHAGGSTDSVGALACWTKLGEAAPLPRPLRREPWTPLLARLDSMVKGPPCPAPPPSSGAAPAVLFQDAATGVVSPSGLFPSRLRSRPVLAPCEFSRTGFAVRPLAAHELWGLWDVPILLQDLAAPGTAEAASLSALLDSAPAKALRLGSECLLEVFFPGGGSRPARGGAS